MGSPVSFVLSRMSGCGAPGAKSRVTVPKRVWEFVTRERAARLALLAQEARVRILVDGETPELYVLQLCATPPGGAGLCPARKALKALLKETEKELKKRSQRHGEVLGARPEPPAGAAGSPGAGPGAGRGAGAAVPDLPGRDAGPAHARALPPLVLRGMHRAGAAGALRLPRLRPLLRAAGGQPAPRRPHAGDPRRRAAPARLRGLRHHHHPVRLPARRAGGGAPEPGRAVPGHHARGVPARLPRGQQGAGAVPQGLRPAPHLHRGHLADHGPCQRHHLERHPPQDQLHRRAPAVRVPRPHVPRPGAGGAAGQGHHRGLSGGAGTPPGLGEPPRSTPGCEDPSGPPWAAGPPGRGTPTPGHPPRGRRNPRGRGIPLQRDPHAGGSPIKRDPHAGGSP